MALSTIISAPICLCSAQEVLGNCLALYKDNQRRIVELDERLRQYGYQAEYSGPVVEDPLSHLGCQPGTADAHANVACSMVKLRSC